jgi:hypothetical protein
MKHCNYFLFLILLLCFGSAVSLSAQPKIPIVVSGGAHSLSVPWHPGQVTKRFNPALFVGTDHTLKAGYRMRLYMTGNLGYFRHYWWMTGLFLGSELGIGYALPLGLHTDLRLGAGYLHYFWRRKSLELKDGAYVQVTNWGRPSIMFPLSIVLGYRGPPERPLPVAPFISMQWAVQTPFVEESPAMTHLFFLVGVRIDWGRGGPVIER